MQLGVNQEFGFSRNINLGFSPFTSF